MGLKEDIILSSSISFIKTFLKSKEYKEIKKMIVKEAASIIIEIKQEYESKAKKTE